MIAVGSGMALGEHEVTNEDLARVCDTSDEWIRTRTGITRRHFVAAGTSTSDLGVRAARAALADAAVEPGEIDYVIFATMTPDYFFPGAGALLQAKLGLGQVPTLDIRQQCAAFLYGLQVADSLLRAGAARKLLFVSAEVHSGFMPWRDHRALFGTAPPPSRDEYAFNTRFRDRAVLFGDGAGALVLTRDEDPQRGLLDVVLHTDGRHAEKLFVPTGFKWHPYVSTQAIEEGRHIPVMDGPRVFRAALARLPAAVHAVLHRNGLELADISLLLAHQANLRLNEAVQKVLGLPAERVYNNIQRYGNTTAATIPLLFDECRRAGRIQSGDLICFVAFGAGFHWGAALWRA